MRAKPSSRSAVASSTIFVPSSVRSTNGSRMRRSSRRSRRASERLESARVLDRARAGCERASRSASSASEAELEERARRLDDLRSQLASLDERIAREEELKAERAGETGRLEEQARLLARSGGERERLERAARAGSGSCRSSDRSELEEPPPTSERRGALERAGGERSALARASSTIFVHELASLDERIAREEQLKAERAGETERLEEQARSLTEREQAVSEQQERLRVGRSRARGAAAPARRASLRARLARRADRPRGEAQGGTAAESERQRRAARRCSRTNERSPSEQAEFERAAGRARDGEGGTYRAGDGDRATRGRARSALPRALPPGSCSCAGSSPRSGAAGRAGPKVHDRPAGAPRFRSPERISRPCRRSGTPISSSFARSRPRTALLPERLTGLIEEVFAPLCSRSCSQLPSLPGQGTVILVALLLSLALALTSNAHAQQTHASGQLPTRGIFFPGVKLAGVGLGYHAHQGDVDPGQELLHLHSGQ